jgi:5-deoxy-glucuronate isomerase
MSVHQESAPSAMDLLLRGPQGGFIAGYTPITREVQGPGIAVDFGIRRMRRGEETEVGGAGTTQESVWVLLQGEAEFNWGCQGSCRVQRHSLFDEAPTTLHVDANTRLHVHAMSDTVEWAVIATQNAREFEPRVFRPEDIDPEYRGRGLAQDTCLRNVRLIFDRARRPDSNLVVGEVINYPGRWSSYPPHHHAQPELYHYRFTSPQGYGHGEVGERVFRVRQNDTLRIPGGNDHAQVAAPGYGMYYLWIVRHLRDAPYEGFTFAPGHEWLLQRDAPIWEPSEGPFPGRHVASDPSQPPEENPPS